uniref:Uncharacterized protein n=1 Tax=Ralstonia solanacearum TaxID=305 RepID=A0A0S4UX75_RALSL|nr:protein of unknown function [Ralstonia solanacearum]
MVLSNLRLSIRAPIMPASFHISIFFPTNPTIPQPKQDKGLLVWGLWDCGKSRRRPQLVTATSPMH